MSMTSQEYSDWCDAVSNTNKAIEELWDQRKQNYKWMGNHLREFFGDLGDVMSVKTSEDGSVFRVRMNGRVKLEPDKFASLPFTFDVQVNEANDLVFYLYPDVEVYTQD